MKKSASAIAILTLLLVLPALPLAAASSGNEDITYSPMDIYTLASTNTVTATPNFNPLTFCAGTGLVCYSPQFLQSAYDFPSTLTGAGQTIVIVDAYGSQTIASDLALFDSVFGLPPPPSFTIICGTGGCPNPSFGPSFNGHSKDVHGIFSWSIETSLDVEYAHAMAPGANIVLDVASSSSGDAINVAESTVIPMFPGAIMSQSFGTPEYLIHDNNVQINQAEQNYETATQDGWTLLASAGDSGATNGQPTPNPSFPSSDPLVTAVGGTQGNPYPGGLAASSCPTTGSSCAPSGYGGEQVWNEPALSPPAAGGGAPSDLFATPSYQAFLHLSSRATPDVSYNAAVNGGVLVVWSACPSCIGATGPVFFIVGGTSAGSPQWAAITALADQSAGHSLGQLNPRIYQTASSSHYASDFHDITVGNNQLAGTPAGFSAGTGWDDATGWGTPNVANLIPDLITPP